MFNKLFDKKEKNTEKGKKAKKTETKDLFDKTTANKSDISKLEFKIKQEQTEMKKMFMQIGLKYYENYRDDSHEELLPLCNVVDESNRVIDMCKKQVNYILGIQLCPSCGAKLSLDSLFCNKCGFNLNEEEKEESEEIKEISDKEIIKCRECGSEILDDSVYCANCGAKVR